MNMSDVVQLARIGGSGGIWGVQVHSVWGPVRTEDVNALITQIALAAHVAEGRNAEERNGQGSDLPG